MKLVGKKQKILDNIILLETYLVSGNPIEKEFAENLIEKGKTFIVYKVDGKNHFAPSRFLGYIDNSMSKHIVNEEKDGRDTNPVISKILGNSYLNKTIEDKYIDYCNESGFDVLNNKRKYWRISKADLEIDSSKLK